MSAESDAVETLSVPGFRTLPRSVASSNGAVCALVEGPDGNRFLAAQSDQPDALTGLDGERSVVSGRTLLLGSRSVSNAAALRARLPWLRPSLLGLRPSAGLGDRLGLATPGHLRAARAVGGNLAIIPAQQSIREMHRTERSPQQVMDDAMWGVFAEGWRAGFGADADHLKTTADIDACLAAGYTFYTFDPGEHVVNAAETASPAALRAMSATLPWRRLEDSAAALSARYLRQPFQIEDHLVRFDEVTLWRAAAKYAPAIAQVVALYRHLQEAASGRPWEVEVSVDETDLPTSHAEHVYLATELRRLGVRWVSLAPRYIGQFEKGIDYIGDVVAFEADFAAHAAIARALGPYKLSLHSGSDKFSVYAAAARQTRGLAHLKTAGTSYLEALRTVAVFAPDLLREIYAFARERFETDRASYHISARLDRAPAAAALSDGELATLLEQPDSRQILHVTFGSVLTARDAEGNRRFSADLIAVLRRHAESYADTVQAHFERHLRPFVTSAHA